LFCVEAGKKLLALYMTAKEDLEVSQRESCRGDEVVRADLPTSPSHHLQDVRTLSRAWVHFLEGFVMLMSGMAPTYESSQRECALFPQPFAKPNNTSRPCSHSRLDVIGQQTPNPILKQHKKNTKNLWLKPPTGYTFMPINCHLTMYEGRGQHPNMRFVRG
jgi:hypothetical protein